MKYTTHKKSWSFLLALCCQLVMIPKLFATIVITGGTWTSNGLGSTVTDPDITITGTFVINTNATFYDCPNIKMGNGASIEVNDGVTFTVNKSHLYTTGNYMWRGIMMKGTATTGGTILINDVTSMTTIEDAEQAIYGGETGTIGYKANYNFDLNGVYFNRNIVSIYKYNTSPYYSVGATHNVGRFIVTCVADVTANPRVPTNLKSNFRGDSKPEMGMAFGRVSEVNLGHMHPGVRRGLFEYLNAGVHSFHSVINAYLCDFSDIHNYDPSNMGSFGNIGFNAYWGDWLGNTSPPFRPQTKLVYCQFNNMQYGINSGRHGDMRVLTCGFTDCMTGIYSHGDQNSNIEIDLSGSIDCDYGVMAANNTFTNLKITRNNFRVNWPAKYSTAPFNTTGVTISPSAVANTGTVTISDNEFTCGRAGVVLSMASGCTVKDNIFRNQAYVVPSPVIPGAVVARRQINVIGGGAHIIKGNSLRGTTIGGTLPGGVNSPVELQYGLTSTTSNGNTITCNSTGNQYAGFHFQGFNYNTDFHGNTFAAGTDFVTGVYLEDWAIAGAYIGMQGASSTTASGHDNDFDGNYTISGGYRTMCEQLTTGSLSPFIYRTGSTASPSPNGGVSPITIFGTAPAGTVVPCSPALAFKISGPGNVGTDMEPIDAASLTVAFAIAADTLYGPSTDAQPYNEMLRFNSRRALYAYLDERPELRSSSYPELKDFYSLSEGTDYVLLYQADKALLVFRDTLITPETEEGADAIAVALDRMNAVNPDNPYAAYEAQLRLITAGKLIADTPGYSLTEQVIIETIANRCPGELGMVVYMARNMTLGWNPEAVYSDSVACAGGMMKGGSYTNNWGTRAITAVTRNTTIAHSFAPNPADDNATLTLLQALNEPTEISFYDITGRIVTVKNLPLKTSKLTIDLSKWSSGLYIYSNKEGTIRGKFVKK